MNKLMVNRELKMIELKKETALQSVERVNEKNETTCIAQGYEISQELTTEVNGEMQSWTERRFLIQSTSGLEAATQGVRERIQKAEQAIQALSVRKQGKMRLKTREEVEKAIQEVLKNFQVKELLDVTIYEEYQEQGVRAYKGKIAAKDRTGIGVSIDATMIKNSEKKDAGILVIFTSIQEVLDQSSN